MSMRRFIPWSEIERDREARKASEPKTPRRDLTGYALVCYECGVTQIIGSFTPDGPQTYYDWMGDWYCEKCLAIGMEKRPLGVLPDWYHTDPLQPPVEEWTTTTTEIDPIPIDAEAED